jgi:hypothetical protein
MQTQVKVVDIQQQESEWWSTIWQEESVPRPGDQLERRECLNWLVDEVDQQGIPGMWIGNTAEEVTRQVECSMLAIKPTDFTFLLPRQSRSID